MSQVEQQDVTEGFSEGADASERLVLEASALPGSEAVPSEILIAPWGQVCSASGEFVMDEEAARLVIAAFRAHGTDVPIDYEHQSLGGAYASPSGQAPAAGWIRELRAVAPTNTGEVNKTEPLPAGLWGRVEWTEAAHEKLAAREYRYLSPVVLVRKRDRRVVELHSAALTNKPAIAGMKPIVNRLAAAGEPEVFQSSRETSCTTEAPKLDDNADAGPGLAEAVEVLRLRVGLEPDATAASVIVAAAERLELLEREACEQAAEQKVTAAMRAGKLTPAMRSWAKTLALKDAEAFESWQAAAPVVVMLGRTEGPATHGTSRTNEAVIASARAEYRAQPDLVLLTSETAWIADALREQISHQQLVVSD